MYIKKIVSLAIFTFSFILGTAHAYYCDGCKQDCSRWCCSCENYAFLRPAQPLTNCGYFIGGEFLYWGARENNLDFVQTDISTITQIRGALNYVQYDWCPGGRVWGGYRWGCDGWESSFVYTYFYTKGSEAVNQGGGLALAPLLANPILNLSVFSQSVIEAEIEIKLKYQTLDLLFSQGILMKKI